MHLRCSHPISIYSLNPLKMTGQFGTTYSVISWHSLARTRTNLFSRWPISASRISWQYNQSESSPFPVFPPAGETAYDVQIITAINHNPSRGNTCEGRPPPFRAASANSVYPVVKYGVTDFVTVPSTFYLFRRDGWT